MITSPEKMEAIRKLSELRVTDVTSLKRGENGTVTMKVRAAGNGASFLVIEPTELAGRARGEP